MKAKHTVAHIKSSSAWSKILCALMAIALLSLMVPSGLRAYANEPVVKQNVNENTTDSTAEGVNNEVSANPFTLNSDATFIPSSVNAAETAGHFMAQTAEVGLGDVLKERGSYPERKISNMDELYSAIGSANLNATWGKGLLNGYTEEETSGNIFADLSNALIFPSDDPSTEDFNKIIFYPWTEEEAAKLGEGHYRSTNGYVEYMWITLGEGDIFDMINHGVVHAKRLVPVMPAMNNRPFVNNALMGSNLQADNASTVARFLNWEVSFDGTNYMPVDWILETLEQGYFSIMPGSHYYFRANFYDMEGMTLLHLDFSGANTFNLGGGVIERLSKDDEDVPLEYKLREDGWYTTDSLRGSVWTIAVPNWMPTWLVYSYIFERYGENIFERADVFKDQQIRNVWIGGGDKPFNADPNVVYPGPHMVEFSNYNWEGVMDQETTITFSWYPISPRGRVMHSYPYNPFDDDKKRERYGASKEETTEIVKSADVMFYDKFGFPLFDRKDFHYDSMDVGSVKYYFSNHSEKERLNENGRYAGNLAYCYDEEVNYAVVYAEGYNDDIFVPLYAEAKDFNITAALLQDYGYADFQVERMMFGDLESAWFNEGVASYDVAFFEDGKQLFDNYTIDNPWEMAMFGLPLVTNGTITTGGNRLVSAWNAYVDWMRPFGEVNPLNAFQDQNNFKFGGENHFFQVQLTANVKAGYSFDSWRYDFAKFSADTYIGENAVIVEEPILLDNHIVGAAAKKVASAKAADVETLNPASASVDGNVALASENTPAIAANPTAEGTAQTGDCASIACAIFAALALAGCGIFAGRKLYSK